MCKSKSLVAVITGVMALLSFGACVPQLTYKEVPDNPASPTNQVLVFSLRNSDILVAQTAPSNPNPPAAGSVKSNTLPIQAEPTNTCTGPGADPYLKCLSKVTVAATPAREEDHVYSAEPNTGTTLTTTAVDTDPLMLKSMTVNYKNPAVGLVNSAGAGATTGFAIGGPYGALAGAGIGVLGGIISMELLAKREHNLICPEDRAVSKDALDALKRTHASLSSLDLPVVLKYQNNISECWHVLPKAIRRPPANNGEEDKSVTGWFYRFTPALQKKAFASTIPPVVDPIVTYKSDGTVGTQEIRADDTVFVKRESYFRDTGAKETFPISACRRIEVQITWWENLDTAKLVDGYPEAARYPVMVADSEFIQPVHIPENGIISLMPVCGGFGSATLSSPPSTELIDAIVKQTQAIKDAQTKYNSVKQSTKPK